MKIFDLHADIGYDVMQKRNMGKHHILRDYHLAKFRKGNITYVGMASYFEGKESWKDMQAMVLALKEEIALCDDIDLVLSKKDLVDNGNIKAILTIEGMCGIKEKPKDKIQWLYEQGVRIASLCWNDENALATGVKGNSHRGLSALGKVAVQKMIELNMLVDISHANERTLADIAHIQGAKMIATHSNVRILCNHPRNLWDEQIHILKEHAGIMGIVSAATFVDRDIDKQDIPHLIKHIRYACTTFGVDMVALGFDFMDFYEGENNVYTKGLQDCSYAQNLIDEMRKQGFKEDEIERIAYLNALRIINSVLTD